MFDDEYFIYEFLYPELSGDCTQTRHLFGLAWGKPRWVRSSNGSNWPCWQKTKGLTTQGTVRCARGSLSGAMQFAWLGMTCTPNKPTLRWSQGCTARFFWGRHAQPLLVCRALYLRDNPTLRTNEQATRWSVACPMGTLRTKKLKMNGIGECSPVENTYQSELCCPNRATSIVARVGRGSAWKLDAHHAG